MVRRDIIELLKRYIDLLEKEGISVRKAYLFGSYSSDTANESSDIDVMIVSDNYDESDDVTVGKTWKLTRQVHAKIEPYLISLKRFINEDPSPFISMVKEKGVEIV